ncbi:MAG TPA: fluoride efflux transporter CrcB [Chitinophagaceae bacterium]
MIKSLLLIASGGAAGSVMRFLVQKWFAETTPSVFPWGTFVVNLAGCFLIGLIFAVSERMLILGPRMRFLLITGFCGGFTTFSAFSFENLALLRSGEYAYALLYGLLSVVLGIAAVFGGIVLAKAM